MKKLIGTISLGAAAMLIAAAMQPASAQTMSDLKTCQNFKGDPDDQIRACSIFIRTRRAVGGRAIPTAALTAVLALRAYAHQRKGDNDLALDDYARSLDVNPKNPGAYQGRALLYARRREYDRAFDEYAKAISVGVGTAVLSESYANRGFLNLEVGNFSRALSDFSEAIRINPKYAAGYRGRGRTYAFMGDPERANADYQKAMQFDPASRKIFEDEKDLEIGWVTYLQDVQNENDYANWSGPPLDLRLASTGGRGGDAGVAAAPATATPPPAKASCDIAATHWTSTESIGTLAAFEDHLARFPDCAFAGLAKARIAALQQGGAKPKNCASGQVLDGDGDCVSAKKRPERKSAAARTAPARSSGGGGAPLPDNSIQQIPTLINRAIQSVGGQPRP